MRMRRVPFEFRRNTLPVWTENAHTLEDVKQTYGVDIAQLIRTLGKKNPRVLDSGAGLLKVSIGLKERFGTNIYVEALTLHRPERMSAEERQQTDAAIAHLEKLLEPPVIRGSTSLGDNEALRLILARLNAHDVNLEETLEKMHLVDRISISYLEHFKAEGKYDVIIDLLGPARH